ncbi:nucleotide disphospho-sugar-binding domain-containing protein [Micromonospora sp. NPDC049559]|uniref:glycosyltransferase n=1 Tax=Micromonospora sp. NPDC049559 TaxID=3155923 RepID=UPI0034377648
MARLVMAASAIYRHVEPMRKIAADLVRRGHDVTFLTGSIFQEYVEKTGARFVPFTGSADLGSLDLAEMFPERRTLPEGPERLAFDVRQLFVEGIPDQHATLQRVLAEAGEEPVVLLAEMGFAGVAPSLLGAPGHRPAAVIGIGVLPLTLGDYPPSAAARGAADAAGDGVASGAADASGDDAAGAEGRAGDGAREEVFGATQARMVELLRELGATETPPFILDCSVLLADRFLQLGIEGLEHTPADAPDSLRFVGPMPFVTNKHLALPEWWDDVRSAERVVVVSQGTMTNQDFGELLEPTLRALADLDVLVVATLGRDGTLAEVPANARVAEFIPFDRLLPHADVFVTNGGYARLHQALGHGVPLVLAGLGETQTEVRARIARTGAAVNLATQRPDESEIRKAVETVLGDPSYRSNARRLQAEYAGHDPFKAIADTIDELLAEVNSRD